MNWAIVGLGFISQRHIDAIKDTGGRLLAACDIDVSKKRKLPKEVKFFDQWSTMLESGEFKKVEWVSVCTPNHEHFRMVKDAVRAGKKVLCEKPLVIDSSQIFDMEKFPNVYTVLQLRHNKEIQDIKKRIGNIKYTDGAMNINMHRGEFYFKGWKNDELKSGGLLFNIGIHYFDLLVYLFGTCIESAVYERKPRYADGACWFDKAKINWHISIDAPMDNQTRILTIGNETVHLDRHFEGLHTNVYEDVLSGKGVSISEAGRAIRLVESLNKL